MAKGRFVVNWGFVVNWDGQQERCIDFEVYYNKKIITFLGEKQGCDMPVRDWSTFSVHAITGKDIKDVLEKDEVGEVKK